MRNAILILCLTLMPFAAFAQDEDGPSTPGVFSGSGPEGVGAVIGNVPVTFDTSVIGIEHDGSGNLLYTANTSDEIGVMGTDGAQIMALFTAAQGTGTNPIGVTTDGSNFYVTDTVDDEVEIYDSTGAPIGTFSVLAQTGFPEGLTYSPETDQIFVIDGEFTTSPPDSILRYQTNGTFLGQTDLTTLSNDGAGYDPARCSVWVYESAGDSITQFSEFDQSILTTFAGTNTAGFGGGEGVAVIGDVLYVMAAGTDTLVSFDIADAPSVCLAGEPVVEVPTLNWMGMVALFALLAVAAAWMLARRRQQA